MIFQLFIIVSPIIAFKLLQFLFNKKWNILSSTMERHSWLVGVGKERWQRLVSRKLANFDRILLVVLGSGTSIDVQGRLVLSSLERLVLNSLEQLVLSSLEQPHKKQSDNHESYNLKSNEKELSTMVLNMLEI